MRVYVGLCIYLEQQINTSKCSIPNLLFSLYSFGFYPMSASAKVVELLPYASTYLLCDKSSHHGVNKYELLSPAAGLLKLMKLVPSIY